MNLVSPGQRVNVMILEKAITLELAQFEDAEFYDKLTRARRVASSRPLSLVNRTFGLGQNLISLVSYGVLLVQFSPWAVLILVLAGLPSFVAETRFSGEAFTLFRWRSPETRMQIYLETVIAREDNVKEVKLFQLGPRLLLGTGRRTVLAEHDMEVRPAESEGIGEKKLIPLPARSMRNHVNIGQFRVGYMVNGRQEQPLLHRLYSQGGLDCGGGPQGVADLGFV